MTGVDWSSMFKTFYESVRVKITCRDPCKIPIERLFEMDKKLYKVYFQVEGFVQNQLQNCGPNDDDQNDDDDDCGDLDDEATNKENMDMDHGTNAMPPSKTPNPTKSSGPGFSGAKTVSMLDQGYTKEFLEGAQFYKLEKEMRNTSNSTEKMETELFNSFQAHVGLGEQLTPEPQHGQKQEVEQESSHSLWNKLLEEGNEASRCTQLLRSMEMIGSESESKNEVVEEKDNLEQNVVNLLSVRKNLLSELSKCLQKEEEIPEKKRIKREKKWGPILPSRKSSRHPEDGKSIPEKAQGYIEYKNLEKPKIKGEKWRNAQEVMKEIMRTLMNWKFLCKEEKLGRMEEALKKWEEESSKILAVGEREWWSNQKDNGVWEYAIDTAQNQSSGRASDAVGHYMPCNSLVVELALEEP